MKMGWNGFAARLVGGWLVPTSLVPRSAAPEARMREAPDCWSFKGQWHDQILMNGWHLSCWYGGTTAESFRCITRGMHLRRESDGERE